MKSNLTTCFAFVLFVGCSNNKAEKETTVTKSEQQSEVASNSQANPSGDGIIGTWKLTLEAYDDNDNKTLDEEERKNGIKNRYSYRFNADGSCLIQEIFKGRYEIRTEGDKKMLYVYRNRIAAEEDQDPPPDVYHIISMNKKDLVLLENLGNLVFWVFERA